MYLLCSNSSPILELSVKCASQICHENINKPLDGTYLAHFGIDIATTAMPPLTSRTLVIKEKWTWNGKIRHASCNFETESAKNVITEFAISC